MNGFDTNVVGLSNNSLIVPVLACHYLSTQGAQLSELQPQPSVQSSSLLFGVGYRGLLVLNELSGYSDTFLKVLQFCFQELKHGNVSRSVSLGVQNCFLFIKKPTSSSNISFQRILRTPSLNPLASHLHLRMEKGRCLASQSLTWGAS
jgi:hypothetical protein